MAKKEDEGDPKRLPVRFIGRSDDSKNDDGDRVQKVQDSKGYKGALEMVYEAVQKRATDIHMEPTKSEMAVRLRIDGILTTVTPFTRAMGDAVGASTGASIRTSPALSIAPSKIAE